MGESTLDRIKQLEAERQRLKEAALAKAMEGVAELNELGFKYELRERRKKAKSEEASGENNSDGDK